MNVTLVQSDKKKKKKKKTPQIFWEKNQKNFHFHFFFCRELADCEARFLQSSDSPPTHPPTKTIWASFYPTPYVAVLVGFGKTLCE